MKTEDLQKNFIKAVEAITAKNEDAQKLQIIKAEITDIDDLGINYYFSYQTNKYSAKTSITCKVGDKVYILFTGLEAGNIILAGENSSTTIDEVISLTEIVQQYYLSASNSVAPSETDPAWTSSIPTITQEMPFIWQRSKQTFSNATTKYIGVGLYNVNDEILKNEINNTTDGKINDATGYSGGNVILKKDGTHTTAILILDKESETEAFNKIQLDSTGLSFWDRETTDSDWVNESIWKIGSSFSAESAKVSDIVSSMFSTGVIKLGDKLNQSGKLEVYDDANNLVVNLDNKGLMIKVQDGSKITLTADGLVGTNKNGVDFYWARSGEFNMDKCLVSTELTIGNKFRFIPMTITDSGGTVINDGIGLVAVGGNS